MKRILLSLALLTAAFGLNAQTELVAPPKVTEAVDIKIVSCVGYPQSGQVALTITLTPNNFMLNANIAGGWEGRAYDAAGNSSSVDIKLTLVKKPNTYIEPDVLYAEAQKVCNCFSFHSTLASYGSNSLFPRTPPPVTGFRPGIRR